MAFKSLLIGFQFCISWKFRNSNVYEEKVVILYYLYWKVFLFRSFLIFYGSEFRNYISLLRWLYLTTYVFYQYKTLYKWFSIFFLLLPWLLDRILIWEELYFYCCLTPWEKQDIEESQHLEEKKKNSIKISLFFSFLTNK